MAEIDKAKILAGRKAVDAYVAAHAKLHLGRVKADGTIVPPANISEKHAPLLEKMLSELRALGFESQDAFRDFNGLACGLEKIRCYKLEGTCDGCVGRERGCYPDCIEKSLYFNPESKTLDAQKSDQEKLTKIDQQVSDGTLTLEKLKAYGVDFFSWRKFPGNQPPNCSLRYVKVAEPRFDIYWGIRVPAIEPEQYEKDKKLW